MIIIQNVANYVRGDGNRKVRKCVFPFRSALELVGQVSLHEPDIYVYHVVYRTYLCLLSSSSVCIQSVMTMLSVGYLWFISCEKVSHHWCDVTQWNAFVVSPSPPLVPQSNTTHTTLLSFAINTRCKCSHRLIWVARGFRQPMLFKNSGQTCNKIKGLVLCLWRIVRWGAVSKHGCYTLW